MRVKGAAGSLYAAMILYQLEGAARRLRSSLSVLGPCCLDACIETLGAQFTFFTSTKVKILTQKLLGTLGTQFSSFASTKVQILTQKLLQASSPRSSTASRPARPAIQSGQLALERQRVRRAPAARTR